MIEQELEIGLSSRLENYIAGGYDENRHGMDNYLLNKVPVVFNKEKLTSTSKPFKHVWQPSKGFMERLKSSNNKGEYYDRIAEDLGRGLFMNANGLALALLTREPAPVADYRVVFGNYHAQQKFNFRYTKPDNVSIVETIQNILNATKYQKFNTLTFSSKIFRYLSAELAKIQSVAELDAHNVRCTLADMFNCVIEVFDGSFWREALIDYTDAGKLQRVRFLSNDTVLFSNKEVYGNPDVWKIECSIPEIEIKDGAAWISFHADAHQYQDGLTAVLYVNADN